MVAPSFDNLSGCSDVHTLRISRRRRSFTHSTIDAFLDHIFQIRSLLGAMLLSFLLFLHVIFIIPPCGATVNSALLATLERVSGYAAAAYCRTNYRSGADLPATFPPNTFDQDGFCEIVHSFLNVNEHDTSGLIMLDHTNEAIIITFRGTISHTDWNTNLEGLQYDASDICGEGCIAHSGFLASWESVADNVKSNWTSVLQQYPQYDTIITGHSLGGTLAHICAASLKKMRPNATMSLYTYASPRVGNLIFANSINEGFGNNNHRVTHLNDPVPRLLGRLFGFDHTSPEYHITSPHIRKALSANKKTLAKPANLVVAADDILVLPGPENEAGSLRYSCTNIEMHDEYFIHIAACAVDSKTSLLSSKSHTACISDPEYPADVWTGFAIVSRCLEVRIMHALADY